MNDRMGNATATSHATPAATALLAYLNACAEWLAHFPSYDDVAVHAAVGVLDDRWAASMAAGGTREATTHAYYGRFPLMRDTAKVRAITEQGWGYAETC